MRSINLSANSKRKCTAQANSRKTFLRMSSGSVTLQRRDSVSQIKPVRSETILTIEADVLVDGGGSRFRIPPKIGRRFAVQYDCAIETTRRSRNAGRWIH